MLEIKNPNLAVACTRNKCIIIRTWHKFNRKYIFGVASQDGGAECKLRNRRFWLV